MLRQLVTVVSEVKVISMEESSLLQNVLSRFDLADDPSDHGFDRLVTGQQLADLWRDGDRRGRFILYTLNRAMELGRDLSFAFLFRHDGKVEPRSTFQIGFNIGGATYNYYVLDLYTLEISFATGLI